MFWASQLFLRTVFRAIVCDLRPDLLNSSLKGAFPANSHPGLIHTNTSCLESIPGKSKAQMEQRPKAVLGNVPGSCILCLHPDFVFSYKPHNNSPEKKDSKPTKYPWEPLPCMSQDLQCSPRTERDGCSVTPSPQMLSLKINFIQAKNRDQGENSASERDLVFLHSGLWESLASNFSYLKFRPQI